MTQIRNFGTPLITFERIEHGTDIEDGPLLNPDHKTTLSGRGIGHVIKFRNFGTPLITFERIETSTSDLAQTYRTDPCCVRTTKRPLSGRGLGHVTEFRNFGTPLITFERMEISASNSAQV